MSERGGEVSPIRELWKRLGELREQKGITGPEAARRMGVHHANIYRWEQEGVKDIETLVRYAREVLEMQPHLDLSNWELSLTPLPRPKPARITLRPEEPHTED